MSSLSKPPKHILNEAQKKMYSSEKLMNFRWIAKVMATNSHYTLTTADLVSDSLHLELAEIGQFAELSYTNTVPIRFIFENLATLIKPDFPLEGYDALQESILVSDFFGKIAHLHGYVAYRPRTKQLIVATSGTSSVIQAIQDLRALMHRHKSRRGSVHSGFWKLYKGIRPFILDGIRKGLHEHGGSIEELVVTGHSMGGAVSYLLLLDLLMKNDIVPSDIRLKLVAFGAPRPGDAGLSKYWQEIVRDYRSRNGEDAFKEYLVKAYNDGVPALPPLTLGYRHFTQEALYSLHGRMYHIPASEAEYALFHVDVTGDEFDKPPQHPRGGHNYYNGRDQEKVIRRMGWLDKTLAKTNQDWEEVYRKKLLKHSV